MATAVLLVRHATHPLVGRVLCGRMAGVQLDPAGRAQAGRLAERLGRDALAALYSSPTARAWETAAIVGPRCGLRPEPCPGFEEIEFGDWTGRGFESLADDPAWRHWNAARATAAPPGGETMRQVQDRVADALDALRRRHPDAVVAVVSHADVIKAAVLAVLGLSPDAHDRLDIAPASISGLALWDGGAKVLWLNEAGAA